MKQICNLNVSLHSLIDTPISNTILHELVFNLTSIFRCGVKTHQKLSSFLPFIVRKICDHSITSLCNFGIRWLTVHLRQSCIRCARFTTHTNTNTPHRQEVLLPPYPQQHKNGSPRTSWDDPTVGVSASLNV